MFIYLHGFNSSPQSNKAMILRKWLEEREMGSSFACPCLPHCPNDAIAAAEAEMGKYTSNAICLIGSSLGGFYATHLAEKHGTKAVLVNPAIYPHIGLRAWLGEQQNLHSGEKYLLTEAHLAQWERLIATRITPERYLLLVETGDEVLDYREALDRYRGCRQVVVEGGDHTLKSFPEHIPLILAFAGLSDRPPGIVTGIRRQTFS